MRVLILSCCTGGGHDAAARAMQERVLAEGDEAVFLDAMSLVSRKTAKRVGGAYVWTAKNTPRLFGAVYRLGMKISSSKRKSPVYYANSLAAGAVASYLEKETFDVILVTHLYPAEILTWLKRKGRLTLPFVSVGTDYTCIPFWEETECDYYVLPHEDCVEEYALRGVPKEKILPYGIPVSLRFEKRIGKERARRAIGMEGFRRLHLIMSGSMGFGKVYLLADVLAERLEDGDGLVIICGNNRRMYRMLQKRFRKNNQVRVIGFTKNVAVCMEACDVIYTKPGGLTSTEARVENIPIIHTAPIPGCETMNSRFFESHGWSEPQKSVLSQARAGERLIHSQERRTRMLEQQKRANEGSASWRIYRLLKRITEEQEKKNAV